MGGAPFSIGQKRRIDPDDLGDLIGERQQLFELFGRDGLVLGTRVADDLIFIHFLIGGKDGPCFESSCGQLGRKAGQIEQFWRRGLFQGRRIDDDRARFEIDVDFFRRLETLPFFIDIHVAVFVLETQFIKRFLFVAVHFFELIADHLDHGGFEPSLAEHGLAVAIGGRDPGELHG